MRLHPREEIVRQAGLSLSEKILDWLREDGTAIRISPAGWSKE